MVFFLFCPCYIMIKLMWHPFWKLTSFDVYIAGLDQLAVIEIPPRTVLLKLMEANGAKGPPIFTCIASESLHFKVCVQLDVSICLF